MSSGRIEYNDLVNPNVTAEIKKLEAAIRGVSTEAKKVKVGMPKDTTNPKQLNQLQKEAIRLEQRYNDLSKEGTRANLEQKEAIRKKTQAIKDDIRATNEKVGSMNAESLKLKKLKEDYRKLSKEERENANIGGKLLKNIQDQDSKLKEMDGTLGDHQRNVGDYKNQIINAFQQMGIPVGGVTRLLQAQTVAQEGLATATASGAKTMKIFRLALISTGIGAIVVALGALAAGFLSTQRGVDAVNKVMIPLRTVMQRLWGIVQELGTGLVDAFKNPKQAIKDLWETLKTNIINRFTGIADQFRALGKIINAAFSLDFAGMKEGAAELGESTIQVLTGVDDLTGKVAAGFGKLKDEIGVAADEGKRLAEIKMELERLAITTALQEGKLTREFEEQRTILNDVNKADDVRLKAGLAAIDASEKSKNLKLKELELLIEEQQIKMKQNDSDTAIQLELAKLQAQRETLEATHLKETLRIKNRLGAITKTTLAETRKELEALANFEKETVDIIVKQLQDEINDADLIIEPDIDFENDGVDEDLKNFVDKYTAAQNMISKFNTESTAERIEREKKAIEEAREENLISEEQYQNALNYLKDQSAKEEKERQEKIQEFYNSTAENIGESLGRMITDSKVTFKDFAKEMLLMTLNMLEKQVLISMAGATATEAASKPFPANLITTALKILAIKTAFTVAKSAVNTFEQGEINIQGRRHSQGGIPAEIEGGESVINREGTRNAIQTLKLINTGQLRDNDIMPFIANMKGFDQKIDISDRSQDMIKEQRRTNELLSRFRIIADNGKTITDLNGNIVRYV